MYDAPVRARARQGFRPRREGTTIVEVAVVLPVFLIFLFGLWAYGHAQMVSNMLKGAARSAARMGATEGVTTAQAKARVAEVMGAAVDASKIIVHVRDASAYDDGSAFPTSVSAMNALPELELKNAESRQLFMVRAAVNYNTVAVVPATWFDNVQLAGTSFMRHE